MSRQRYVPKKTQALAIDERALTNCSGQTSQGIPCGLASVNSILLMLSHCARVPKIASMRLMVNHGKLELPRPTHATNAPHRASCGTGQGAVRDL